LQDKSEPRNDEIPCAIAGLKPFSPSLRQRELDLQILPLRKDAPIYMPRPRGPTLAIALTLPRGWDRDGLSRIWSGGIQRERPL